MALFEGKTPAERNKTIAAAVLGVLALLFLGRMLFGGSGAKTTTTNSNRARQTAGRGATAPGAAQQPEAERIEVAPQPVVYERTSFDGGEPGRNIFAYYVRPVGAPKPTVEVVTPEQTPTPPPPLTLSGLAPQSVYAQTAEFDLQVAGDKFTPAARVYVEGQELATEFRNPQNLGAKVPAQLIQTPGVRRIEVRTPDGQLYSNPATLNVMPAPVPNFTFIGYIGRPRANNEGALLKDQRGDLLSVQLRDKVGGRFVVTSISARSVELMDEQLKIKHTLPYVEGRSAGGPMRNTPMPQPPPQPVEEEEGDEEPDDE
ncbi:MAG TPA: hypothetical protein VER32_04340 [Pyrinomonadaceae bacterium]|nr:hypothetical protein [Pyrinomonadaceae bacterium]